METFGHLVSYFTLWQICTQLVFSVSSEEWVEGGTNKNHLYGLQCSLHIELILCAEFLLLNYMSFISLKHRSIICLRLSRDWQTNRQESKWNRAQLQQADLMSAERSVSSPTHTCHSRPTLPRQSWSCTSKAHNFNSKTWIARTQPQRHLCLSKPEGKRVNPHMGTLMTHKA